MYSLPLFCRWQFAPVIVALSTGAGALCFSVLNRFGPCDELDFWFYTNLYCGIGAATGVAAWYLSRLVARRHAPLRLLGILLLASFSFVALLALDKNPVIAVVAAVAFGFIFFLA